MYTVYCYLVPGLSWTKTETFSGLAFTMDSRGLSNTISESDDGFLLLSSQESLFGGWPSRSLEAISCHDCQLLQWALAKSRKWFVFSNSDRGSEIAYFSTEPRHPVNPTQRRDKWMCWWPDGNKTCKIWTDRLSGPTQRQGQNTMKIVSECLLGIFLQWRYW